MFIDVLLNGCYCNDFNLSLCITYSGGCGSRHPIGSPTKSTVHLRLKVSTTTDDCLQCTSNPEQWDLLTSNHSHIIKDPLINSHD